MDLERFNKMLLELVGVGLAVVDPQTCDVIAHNGRFRDWFPDVDEPGCTVEQLLPSLDLERLKEGIQRGRAYTVDVEIQLRRRPANIAVRIERSEGQGQDVLIVACQNVTKIKELEYMIESYSKMIERQNRDLRREKDRVEKLLLNIMPKNVYEEWKELGVTTPKRYEECSILMLDFVDFTEMAVSGDAAALISELNDIFTAFDRIVEQFGCERLKTIGDAYIAVSGIPEAVPEHAHNIARVAISMVRYIERRNQAHPQEWRCRIGINSGPVIGSIVGVQKYVYDIFGPGVNLAGRMETMSEAMEITLWDEMYKLIRDSFAFTHRGTFDIKGFGERELYFLHQGHEPVRAESPF